MSQFEIKEVHLEPQAALVVKFSSEPQTLGEKLGVHFPAIFQYAGRKGLSLTGMPFVRYLEMTDHFLIDAGLPTAGEMEGRDDIVSKVLPGGKAATTLHPGEYYLVGQAWTAITAWCKERGIESVNGGWDVYENDPNSVSDPSELRTRLYQPLPD